MPSFWNGIRESLLPEYITTTSTFDHLYTSTDGQDLLVNLRYRTGEVLLSEELGCENGLNLGANSHRLVRL